MGKTIFHKNHKAAAKDQAGRLKERFKKRYAGSFSSVEENDANTPKKSEESPVTFTHALFEVNNSCDSLQVKLKPHHPHKSITEVQTQIVNELNTDDSSIDILMGGLARKQRKPKQAIFKKPDIVFDGSLEVKESKCRLPTSTPIHPNVTMRKSNVLTYSPINVSSLHASVNGEHSKSKTPVVLIQPLELEQQKELSKEKELAQCSKDLFNNKTAEQKCSELKRRARRTSNKSTNTTWQHIPIKLSPRTIKQVVNHKRKSLELCINKIAERVPKDEVYKGLLELYDDVYCDRVDLSQHPCFKQMYNKKDKHSNNSQCSTSTSMSIHQNENKSSKNTPRQSRLCKSETNTQASLQEVNNSPSKQTETHDIDISIDLPVATPNKSVAANEVANKSRRKINELTKELQQRALSASKLQSQASSPLKKNASFVLRQEKSIRSSPKKTSNDQCNLQSLQIPDDVDAVACSPPANSSFVASSTSPGGGMHVLNGKGHDFEEVNEHRTSRRLFSPKSPTNAKLTTTSKETNDKSLLDKSTKKSEKITDSPRRRNSKLTTPNKEINNSKIICDADALSTNDMSQNNVVVKSNRKPESVRRNAKVQQNKTNSLLEDDTSKNVKLTTPKKGNNLQHNYSKIISDIHVVSMNSTSQNNAAEDANKKPENNTNSSTRKNARSGQNKSKLSFTSLKENTPKKAKLSAENEKSNLQLDNPRTIIDVHVQSINVTQSNNAVKPNKKLQESTESFTKRSTRNQKKSKLSTTVEGNSPKKLKLSNENKEYNLQHGSPKFINDALVHSTNVSQNYDAIDSNEKLNESTQSITKRNTRNQQQKSKLSSTSVEENTSNKGNLNIGVTPNDKSPKSTSSHGARNKKNKNKCDSPVFKKPTARPKRTKKLTDNKETENTEQPIRRSGRERKPRQFVAQEIIVTSSKEFIQHFNDIWYWSKPDTAKKSKSISKNTSQKSNKKFNRGSSFASTETENDKNLSRSSKKRDSKLIPITESETQEEHFEEFEEAHCNSVDSGMQSKSASCRSMGQNKNNQSLNKSPSRSIRAQNTPDSKQNTENKQISSDLESVIPPPKLKPTKEDKNLLFGTYVGAKKYNVDSGFLEIKAGGCKHLQRVPKGDVVYKVEEGSGEIEINGQVGVIKPNFLFIVEKNSTYMIRNTSDVHRLLLYFTKRDMKK